MTIEELKNSIAGGASNQGQAFGGTLVQPQGPCPSCGHCPHCGRGGHQTQPYYPAQPWITWGPYYGTVTC